MNAETDYLVDVIGFNHTERLLLSSIFGLAARRDPSFQQREPNASRPASLYLVDADDDGAIQELRAVQARFPAPAVLVGGSDRGTGMPVTSRPIQWARLLQVFDDEVQKTAASGTQPAGFEKTMVLRRTLPPVTDGGRNAPMAGRLDRSAPPRALTHARKPSDSVLVVDDNATVRKFMEMQLAPFGFSVDFAQTGEEAVGLTGNREYTCVFLDVVLPGIDGYQVCKLIKSNKQAIKRTAVVMLTSRSSPFDKLRGSLAGCDEYLTKPVDENRLLEIVAKFLPSARAGSGRELQTRGIAA